MEIAKSLILFFVAGLCEIGGGYLVWLWLREGRSVWIALIGGVILFSMGLLPHSNPPTLGEYMPLTVVSLSSWQYSGAG